MFRSLLCICLVVSVLGLLQQPVWAGGKKALARVNGKIYLTNDMLKDTSPKALALKFAGKKPSLGLERASDNTWSATLVAFLGRRPVRGPVTLWFYDKGDTTTPLDTRTVDRLKGKKLLIHDMLLDGDLGFKRCHVYVIQVGQIIRDKNKVYATGEVVTDPQNPKCKAGEKEKKAPSK